MLFCLALTQRNRSLNRVWLHRPLNRNQDRIAVLIHLLTVDLKRPAYQPIALGNHKEICG